MKSWTDIIFNTLAEYKQKSLDPNTKYGAALVDDKHRILAMGFNGPCRDLDDSRINLERPHKYGEMLHSEENLLANLIGVPLPDRKKLTVYVDGFPCLYSVDRMAPGCLRKLYHVELRNIIIKPHIAVMVGSYDKWYKDYKTFEALCKNELSVKVLQNQTLQPIDNWYIESSR